MQFKEFGENHLPTIILLHGGGLSWWSLTGIIDELQTRYHVVAPIIDGHGVDGATSFVSIEDSAEKLIRYIDEACQGRVFALGGLSLGAQIVTEVLARRADIAEYAILESALVIPIKGIASLTAASYQLFYGLVKKKWFSKLQAKSLFVPEKMFELYYRDSMNISKQSLIHVTVSNGSYGIKDTLKKSKANVLIIVGEKELGIMKKSAKLLNDTLPCSRLYIAEHMGHGECSLAYSKTYLKKVEELFAARA